MERKHSSTLAAIRQACCLGLPSRLLMSTLMVHLRSLIPAQCCQFTWCAEDGRITNFWSDNFMPRRMAWIILNHRRYEQDIGTTFRDVVMYGRPTGNMRQLWARGFEHSPTYAAVFEPYGFKWLLDGVVRDPMRPYGCFGFLRRRGDPDFSAEEEAILARSLPYVVHAMRADLALRTRFVSSNRSAMLVCDAQGQILKWSALAHQLAVQAFVDGINLDASISGQDFEDIRTRLRDVALQFRQSLR